MKAGTLIAAILSAGKHGPVQGKESIRRNACLICEAFGDDPDQDIMLNNNRDYSGLGDEWAAFWKRWDADHAKDALESTTTKGEKHDNQGD